MQYKCSRYLYKIVTNESVLINFKIRETFLTDKLNVNDSIAGHRKDVDHEFAVLFTIFDENRSWYIKENTYKYASRPETVNPLDPGFILSNRMHGK